MMTVKHITLRGEEFIYPTSHVNYVPGGHPPGLDGSEAPPETLWIYGYDDRARPLTGGTCFVMNEHGKTVSRYDLGASMVGILAEAQDPQGLPKTYSSAPARGA